MKQSDKDDAQMQDREEKIIEIIKENSPCSKDSIYTKGRIPKSKATEELINKLVSQKKIKITHTEKGKIRYYIDQEVDIESFDFIKELKIWIRDYEYRVKNSSSKSLLSEKLLKFLKLRTRILELELKKAGTIDLNDTLEIWNYVMAYMKNPTQLFGLTLLDILSQAIKNDLYYLQHELHSSPRQTKHEFQEIKQRHLRRSLGQYLGMKKYGRHSFGLTRPSFLKSMERLTNDPSEWLKKFDAEKGRTLYKNSPAIENMILRKMFTKKFVADTPEKERWKKFFDAYKESFPKFPIKVFFETLNNEELNEVKKIAEKSGINYDEFINDVNSKEYLAKDTSQT